MTREHASPPEASGRACVGRKTELAELRAGLDRALAHVVVHVDARDDRVVVDVRERVSGRRYRTEGEYLLAADGAASGIRQQLDIALDGRRGLGHFVNVYFRGDLDRWVAHCPALLLGVAG